MHGPHPFNLALGGLLWNEECWHLPFIEKSIKILLCESLEAEAGPCSTRLHYCFLTAPPLSLHPLPSRWNSGKVTEAEVCSRQTRNGGHRKDISARSPTGSRSVSPPRLPDVPSLMRLRNSWNSCLEINGPCGPPGQCIPALRVRRKWQPTPVFLPGESQRQRSLVGCHLWGRRVRHDWSDLAAAAAAVLSPEMTISCTLFLWKQLTQSGIHWELPVASKQPL